MTSLQRYLTTFFSVMPKRFRALGDLKSRKARIDKKVLANELLSDNEIEQLIVIIGRDSILRRAEKRNQDTLRHMIYKLIKADENFEKFYDEEILPQTSELKSMLSREIYEEILIKQTKPLRDYIREMIPQLKKLLREMDEVYRNEAEILQQCYGGNENILYYKNFLRTEEEVGKRVASFFSELKSRSKNFVNFIKAYFKVATTEGLASEILALCIGLALTVFSLWGIGFFSDIRSKDVEEIGNFLIKFILSGTSLSILASLAVHVTTKRKILIKFINDTMI